MNIIFHNETRKVNDLIPYEHNPRQMSEKQVADLKKSLEKFNLAEVPVINVDNMIIAGHQRIKILQLLGRGEEEIDIRVPNRLLTEDEYKEYNIGSNVIKGDWDWGKLANGFDFNELTDWGFDENELKVHFDLNDINVELGDEDRLLALQVYPPEAPKLREKTSLNFETVEDYMKVKKAIEEGKITPESLILLA